MQVTGVYIRVVNVQHCDKPPNACIEFEWTKHGRPESVLEGDETGS